MGFQRQWHLFDGFLNGNFDHELLRPIVPDRRFEQFTESFYGECLSLFIDEFRHDSDFATSLDETASAVVTIFQSSQTLSKSADVLKTALRKFKRGQGDLSGFEPVKQFELEEDPGELIPNLEMAQLVHFYIQVFFVLVLPQPFFLADAQNQSRPIAPKMDVLNRVLRRKSFYTGQLRKTCKFFPGLACPDLFGNVYHKLRRHCECRLEQWLDYCSSEDVARLQINLDSPDSPDSPTDADFGFKIEELDNKNLNQLISEETFFVNGYMSGSGGQFGDTGRVLGFFGLSQHRIVHWNQRDIKSLIYKILGVCLALGFVGGVAAVALLELEVALIAVVGGVSAMSLTKLAAMVLVPFRNSEKEAVADGAAFYRQLARRSQSAPTQMNFFCYSMGSVFTLSCLEQVIRERASLTVNNLVIVAGVSCQSKIVQNISALIGKNGVVLGKIILVSCQSDRFNKIVANYIFERASVGVSEFDYHKAASELESQSEIFREKGFAQTIAHVRDKIKQVDVSHCVDGHLDYKQKFEVVMSLVSEDLD